MIFIYFVFKSKKPSEQPFQGEILQFIELRISRNVPIILEKPPICTFKPSFTKNVKLIFENISQGLSLYGLLPFTDYRIQNEIGTPGIKNKPSQWPRATHTSRACVHMLHALAWALSSFPLCPLDLGPCHLWGKALPTHVSCRPGGYTAFPVTRGLRIDNLPSETGHEYLLREEDVESSGD